MSKKRVIFSGNQSESLRGNATWGAAGGGVPDPHNTSHQNNGTDEISVAGLSGLLADGQTALAHTHAIADLTDDGALAALNTVGTAQIDADAVTYAKMQNVAAASRLLGRGDSGIGDVQEITLGANLTMTGTTLAAAGNTLYARGSFTVATGNFSQMTKNLTLTTTQRATLAGTARLSVYN